jgi:hypothetical protein
MFHKIDNWMMTKLDSLVAWAWYQHEIRKIDFLRLAWGGWFLGCVCCIIILGMTAFWVTLIILPFAIIIQFVAERRSKLSPKAQNERVLYLRRVPWTRLVNLIWITFLVSIIEQPALWIANLSVLTWYFFDDTFVPEGPTKRRKTVRLNLLAPITNNSKRIFQ